MEANLALEPEQLEIELKRYESDLADIKNADQEIERLRLEIELATQEENALDELIKDVKYD